MWGPLSDERTGLSFTAGPRQYSYSRVRVPRDSWPYFTISDSRFPQPGGPGPRIYISQEQGGPVITPSTGFPFRRLLRLAGLRWRYPNQPPRGVPLRRNLLYGGIHVWNQSPISNELPDSIHRRQPVPPKRWYPPTRLHGINLRTHYRGHMKSLGAEINMLTVWLEGVVYIMGVPGVVTVDAHCVRGMLHQYGFTMPVRRRVVRWSDA
jgi:hypothetical protein